jgi:hypothetical protein
LRAVVAERDALRAALTEIATDPHISAENPMRDYYRHLKSRVEAARRVLAGEAAAPFFGGGILGPPIGPQGAGEAAPPPGGESTANLGGGTAARESEESHADH